MSLLVRSNNNRPHHCYKSGPPPKRELPFAEFDSPLPSRKGSFQTWSLWVAQKSSSSKPPFEAHAEVLFSTAGKRPGYSWNFCLGQRGVQQGRVEFRAIHQKHTAQNWKYVSDERLTTLRSHWKPLFEARYSSI